MNHCDHSTLDKETALTFDLGTFEGFSFRHQCAVERRLTANEVIAWNHDRDGEARFWPSGDRWEVTLILTGKHAIVESDLREIDRLLYELGGDSTENFLRIYYAANICGKSIRSLSGELIKKQPIHIFLGTNFSNLRKEANGELFKLYYPDKYALCGGSFCVGLILGTDLLLDCSSWSVNEITFGEQKALIVVP